MTDESVANQDDGGDKSMAWLRLTLPLAEQLGTEQLKAQELNQVVVTRTGTRDFVVRAIRITTPLAC